MRSTSVIFALIAIVLWSSLATISSQVSHVPPFLSVGAALFVSGLASLPTLRAWRLPLRTLLVGIAGIFGYHFLYFSAFRYAPAVEASLLNYLWPLLIILLSPVILPGYHLRPHHLLGALLGLLGASLIVTGGSFQFQSGFNPGYLRGYLLAGSAAFVWAWYSLMTKRVPPFPTAAVGAFCLASGVISLSFYFLEAGFPGGATSLSVRDWLFLVLLGLGPMGAAFFAWDAGLKRGDPRTIGALSYLTPMLSTTLLVVLGGKTLTWVTLCAMILIVSGAVLGSLDVFRRPQMGVRRDDTGAVHAAEDGS